FHEFHISEISLFIAKDLELDDYNEDVVKAAILCKTAILSSPFYVNIDYKVAPSKYV
ncbi:hypothetical protein HGM15179_003784, partial [Zosterops borbonicus]